MGTTDVPALVRNGRLDVLAANRLGRALYADGYDQFDPPGRTGRLPKPRPLRARAPAGMLGRSGAAPAAGLAPESLRAAGG